MTGILDEISSPRVTSPAFGDQQWMEIGIHSDSIKGIFIYASETVTGLIKSCEQYSLATIALLEGDARLILPIMSCARAVHDAVLRICWLVDPSVSSEERFVRSAADFLAKVQGGIPVLRSVEPLVNGGSTRLAEGMESRNGAIDHMRHIGLQVKVNESSGQAQNVRWGDYTASVGLKITDLSVKYTPKIQYAWLLNSGATHSSSWLTEGIDGTWEKVLSNTVFPLLDVSDALAASLLGYVDNPVGLMRYRTHLRRISLMTYGNFSGPYSDVRAYHGE